MTIPLNSIVASSTKPLGGAVFEAIPNHQSSGENQISTFAGDPEEAAHTSYETIKGAGGLPVGTSGKGMLMLSGGIDSPVAGYLALKRGVGYRGGSLC